jgi:hypothetical protein
MGFYLKHDGGNVRVWGKIDTDLNAWTVLGGPVIGFQFQGWEKNMSLIVGDKCMPKYLGSRKLAVQLGEKRQVQFYWQESEEEYHSTCLSIGLFFIQNPELLDWVDVVGKKAALFPGFSAVYSSFAYLSMSYRTQTFILVLSPFRLYLIPFPPSAPQYPPINSTFVDISEALLPASSTFKFCNNVYDYGSDPFGKFTYGDIMFG